MAQCNASECCPPIPILSERLLASTKWPQENKINEGIQTCYLQRLIILYLHQYRPRHRHSWLILHQHQLPMDDPVDLVLLGNKRLMENNVFTFGNCFFLQTNRTAIGTNVACMYATIYYSYHNKTQLTHLQYIKFYRRLIDYTFIIVDENTPFANLKANKNDFGPLNKCLIWDTEFLLNTVNFLDLTITIQPNGDITTNTYQKPDNKYLYWTPTSCQSERNLCSFIFGTLQRHYHKNTFLPSPRSKSLPYCTT